MSENSVRKAKNSLDKISPVIMVEKYVDLQCLKAARQRNYVLNCEWSPYLCYLTSLADKYDTLKKLHQVLTLKIRETII